MERKMYKHNGNTVYLVKNKYANNGRLAVQAFVLDGEMAFPYATITVNLPYERVTDERCAFIDENNLPDIWLWLVMNGIAETTGHIGYSGFCSYHEVRFNLDSFSCNGTEIEKEEEEYEDIEKKFA